MKAYAYSRTQAGIDRRARERGVPVAIIEPPKEEIALVIAPVADNVIPMQSRRIGSQQIIEEIAWKHGFTYADMLGISRNRKLIIARHEAMAEVKKAKPMMSLPQIGRLFHRDFSTVAHALKKMGIS